MPPKRRRASPHNDHASESDEPDDSESLLGLSFPDPLSLKAYVRNIAAREGWVVAIKKSDRVFQVIGCRSTPDCPYHIRTKQLQQGRWEVTVHKPRHTCQRGRKEGIARQPESYQTWLRENVPKHMNVNGDTPVGEIRALVKRVSGVEVPLASCQRLKRFLCEHEVRYEIVPVEDADVQRHRTPTPEVEEEDAVQDAIHEAIHGLSFAKVPPSKRRRLENSQPVQPGSMADLLNCLEGEPLIPTPYYSAIEGQHTALEEDVQHDSDDLPDGSIDPSLQDLQPVAPATAQQTIKLHFTQKPASQRKPRRDPPVQLCSNCGGEGHKKTRCGLQKVSWNWAEREQVRKRKVERAKRERQATLLGDVDVDGLDPDLAAMNDS